MSGQQIRWFAGAAHAVGIASEQVSSDQVPADATVKDFLVARHPAAGVLERCSFLADGRSLAAGDAWPMGAALVDVLPPSPGARPTWAGRM